MRRSGRQGSFFLHLSGGARFAIIAGLVLFLVLDAVLVVFAVKTAHPPVTGTPGPIPTYTSNPSDTTTPSPTDTTTTGPSGTPSPTATAGAADQSAATTGPVPLLAAVSATEAWRAAPGTCSPTSATTSPTRTPKSTGSVQHTTDAGATWNTVAVPVTGLRQVLSLTAATSQTSVVDAAGSGCTVSALSTSNGGTDWKPSSASATYLDGQGTGMHVTGVEVASPCTTPHQVLATANTTFVVCTGSIAERTGTGGWIGLAVPGIQSATLSVGNTYTLAVTGAPGCTGTALERLSSPVRATSTTTTAGCSTQATTSPVSISTLGSSVWLWSGAKTLVSTDGGRTW